MTIATGDAILYATLLLVDVVFDFLILWVISSLSFENYENESGQFLGVSLKKYVKILLIGVSYGFVILTLNLANAAATNLTGISQFAGTIGNIFSLMLNGTLAWSIFIMTWIVVTIWKDHNAIEGARKLFEEVENTY